MYKENIFNNLFGKKQNNLYNHPEYGNAFKVLVDQMGDEKKAEDEFNKLVQSPFGQYKLKRMTTNLNTTGNDSSLYKQGWSANKLGGQQMFGEKPGSH